MTLPQWIVVAIALARAAELVHAHRNARRLIAEGGKAYGDGHYPLIVGLHAAWLALLWWAGGRIAEPDWLLFAFFIVLEAARLWVVATHGRFWTTRVISLPTTPLIRGGPFRWIRHPNYLAIALQLPLLLYAYAAPGWAAILGAAHILLLAHRIRVEEEALRPRRSLA